MQTIFLDFETYYDNEYSLRKMTPVEYILDPRFECMGCAFKYGTKGEAFWVDGPDLQAFFDNLPPDVLLVSHNALFDMCIVAWRYNFLPRMVSDTLGIARGLLGHLLKSLSLENVAMHLGLGVKGKTVHKVAGLHASDIKNLGLWDEYTSYAKNDADLCAGIWKELVLTGKYPPEQLAVADMIIRCAIQPNFVLDQAKLYEHLNEVVLAKQNALHKAMLLGATGGHDLRSNEAFAELLRGVGIDPPTKTSPSTGKTVYAFAKSDASFMDLQEHPDEAVQALVAARLGEKSTLAESRANRLIAISNLEWPEAFKGARAGRGEASSALMPVPLKLHGAHTHRLSGDWKLNLQNFPARKSNALRCALTTAEDEEVVTVDSAQIQARLVACIAKQTDLIEQFARGEDVYSSFATDVFGYQVTKITHPTERFVGKQAVLGLGFGLGWAKFQRQLYIDSLNQTGTAISLDDDRANFVVQRYRGKYTLVPQCWKTLNYTGIQVLAYGAGSLEIAACVFERGAILLPNGMRMYYHNLSQDDNGDWYYQHGNTRRKTYGGSIMENIAQALEQVVMNEAALRIRKRLDRLGVRLALQSHDELVYVCKKAYSSVVKDVVKYEMERRVSWMPELPLVAEVGSGPNYGMAK